MSDLVKAAGGDAGGDSSTETSSDSDSSEDILITKEGKMAVIKLNRPEKFNALKFEV